MMQRSFRRFAPALLVLVTLVMLGLPGCDVNQNPPVAPPVTGGEGPVKVDPADPDPAAISPYADMELSVFRQINDLRRSKGLPALQLDATISARARFHSQRMGAGTVPFGHAGFELRADTIAGVIPLRSAAENVAMNLGYTDPAAKAVDGWLHSAGHYQNIVGDYDLTGVGIDQNGRGEYYFTQMFVKRK